MKPEGPWTRSDTYQQSVFGRTTGVHVARSIDRQRKANGFPSSQPGAGGNATATNPSEVEPAIVESAHQQWPMSGHGSLACVTTVQVMASVEVAKTGAAEPARPPSATRRPPSTRPL